MKKFLASGMFFFFALCVNLNADSLKEDLYKYLEQRILILENFEVSEENKYMKGYLNGQIAAYEDIFNRIYY